MRAHPLLLLAPLWIGGFNGVDAQDTTTFRSDRKNAIGIEVTGLIPMSQSQFSSVFRYPYFLTVRRQVGPGFVRAGAGGNSTESSVSGEDNGQHYERDHSQWTFDYRIGYAVPLIETKRWLVLAGLDAVMGSNGSRTRQTYDDGDVANDKTKGTSYGAGLAVDAQWFIARRIALGTEFNAVWSKSTSERKREFLITTEYNDTSETTTTSFGMTPAFSLFLHAYF